MSPVIWSTGVCYFNGGCIRLVSTDVSGGMVDMWL